jgi:hypothetical protein
MNQHKIMIISQSVKFERNSNYMLWRFHIKHILETKGLWDLVVGGQNNIGVKQHLHELVVMHQLVVVQIEW